MPTFQARLGSPLRRASLSTLQVNLGKRCNMACSHCHVEAGPKRTESMDCSTAEGIIEFLAAHPKIGTLDITGGAPELNPHFRYLVQAGRELGRHVIDRCNLTILLEPGHEDLAEFLRDYQVEVVASLPCYLEDNVDKQRGNGVFQNSIRALQQLNGLGYGSPDTGLTLNLVYNPVGAHLPPPQAKLEADYQRELAARYGIVFNQLFTITNIPIKRYAHFLEITGQSEAYMTLLRQAFNLSTVEGLMCRHQISVDWLGNVYDCDFNQMLELGVPGEGRKLWELGEQDLLGRGIATGEHCYGCTAGAGSSCGGSLT
ncbi:arsenosugar biosynthesis radical SAM (seleno)protein ArsS [Leptolyngbya sp. FACHB-261]|uniref:arsenosugar biosynthesis radical SAM (seleno)protein ArsS n=1 Tax=Leptolyngbya sp. FACHB-261 TaxID=2692806 RepID=UPI0018EF8494|nr:arsenosugar biosynthesis radical SAM (seleno)protein ArsS [Leptolyngbya sp. FACHB-261]